MVTRVLVGGVDLETVGAVGELEDSTIWRSGGYSGDYELTCTFAAPQDFSAPWFHSGASVEVIEDGVLTWSGFLGDPEQGDTWGLTAFGWGADAANYTSDATAGANLNSNVDAAIGRGAGFARYNSLSTSSPVGDELMLDGVLDVAAKTLGKVWWVSLGEIVLRSESTGVDWVMTPNSAYLGTTDQDLITSLAGRYVSAVDGDGNPTTISTVYATDSAASAKFRPHERLVDLTALGLLTSGTATTYTEARFAQVGARSGYTNGFTMTALNSSDVRTTVPDPMAVRAGQRVQLPGITDMRTGVTYLATIEVTLGKVTRRHVTGSADCEPLGLVPRDFTSVLAAAQPKNEVEVL